MKKYISGLRTTAVEKCEGGDAFLKEINESKSWLRMAGIPSRELWLRVFPEFDELNKARFFMCKIVSLLCCHTHFRGVFRTMSNIENEDFRENSQRF